jgi:uncharacterized membrane protein
MEPLELTFGIGLTVLLVVVAVYFGYCQQRTLIQLRHDTDLSLDDRRYLHRQVVRRLFGSVLMLVLAAFLIGWYFLEPDLQALWTDDVGAELTENAKQSLRFLTYYWIAALMVFLVVVVLAVYDMLATARFGARHRRKLVDDRRATLKDEVERLQRDRHRLNGGL